MKPLYDILLLISLTTGVPPEVIRSKSKEAPAATSRHLFSCIAIEDGHNLTSVAKFLYRSHSTIISSKEVAGDLIATDTKIKNQYEAIKKELKFMKIYIAGKITGLDPTICTEKFLTSEWTLKRKGHQVVNPTKLVPSDFDWDKAMDVCLHHLTSCDAIYMQKDWQDSKGAKVEHETAIKHKLKIFYEEVA